MKKNTNSPWKLPLSSSHNPQDDHHYNKPDKTLNPHTKKYYQSKHSYRSSSKESSDREERDTSHNHYQSEKQYHSSYHHYNRNDKSYYDRRSLSRDQRLNDHRKFYCYILLPKNYYTYITKNFSSLCRDLNNVIHDISDIQYDYTISHFQEYILKYATEELSSIKQAIRIICEYLFKEMKDTFKQMTYLKVSILIPDNVIGFIIGIDGKNINHIRDDSDARIEVFQQNSLRKFRQIEIAGNPNSIALAAEKIYGITFKYINFHNEKILNRDRERDREREFNRRPNAMSSYYEKKPRNEYQSKDKDRDREKNHDRDRKFERSRERSYTHSRARNEMRADYGKKDRYMPSNREKDRDRSREEYYKRRDIDSNRDRVRERDKNRNHDWEYDRSYGRISRGYYEDDYSRNYHSRENMNYLNTSNESLEKRGYYEEESRRKNRRNNRSSQSYDRQHQQVESYEGEIGEYKNNEEDIYNNISNSSNDDINDNNNINNNTNNYTNNPNANSNYRHHSNSQSISSQNSLNKQPQNSPCEMPPQISNQIIPNTVSQEKVWSNSNENLLNLEESNEHTTQYLSSKIDPSTLLDQKSIDINSKRCSLVLMLSMEAINTLKEYKTNMWIELENMYHCTIAKTTQMINDIKMNMITFTGTPEENSLALFHLQKYLAHSSSSSQN